MLKRLELTWPDKGKVLLSVGDDGKPIWGGASDVENRLLIQLRGVGETSRDNPSNLVAQGDNLLIRGDNLLALRSLEGHFTRQIKCIYIDPPFGSGNAYEHYDDGLEHTIWLSLLKSRLEILQKLLRRDGFIFVHIDYTELAHLRILMDEIFGRNNFISIISWQRAPQRTVLGQGQTPIITIVEYILIYARDAAYSRLNRLKKRTLATKEVMSQYRVKLQVSKRKTLVKTFENDNNGTPVNIYEFESFRRDSLPSSTPKAEYLKSFNDFYQSVGIHEEHTFMQRVLKSLKAGRAYLVEHTPSRGKHEGREVSDVFIDGRKMLAARDYADVEDGEIYRTSDMDNLWTDIGVTGTASEGGVEFKRGKKPEKLLKRIIELSTGDGDWVLDSFLGSGTTAAVAQKLGRRWVGIEMGEQAETHCLPRLERVIRGEDSTGISKETGWNGGGGFRYCVLGESLFTRDPETHLAMINPRYDNGLLVAALCNMEAFSLNNDDLFQGVRGNTLTHITEEKLTQEYLQAILNKLPEGKSLVVYCPKYARSLTYPEHVEVRRIPEALQIPEYLFREARP